MAVTKATKAVTSGIIESPRDYLLGSSRFAPMPEEIRTGVALDVPEGHVAFIKLSERLAKHSRIRLAGSETFIGSTPEVIIYVDNLGVDAHFIKKGTPIAEYIIVSGN